MGSVVRSMRSPQEPAPTQARAPAPEPAQDIDAFLASVERRAFRMAELALGHREDALDVVQESMIRLLRYRQKPAAEWTPLFWSILRRQVTDRHRRNSLRRRIQGWLGRVEEDGAEPFESLPDPGLDPAGELMRQQRWEALGRALRELPRRQRECFLLRELQGLSVTQTAASMGCSEGSVKTHLSRALAALRERMETWQ